MGEGGVEWTVSVAVCWENSVTIFPAKTPPKLSSKKHRIFGYLYDLLVCRFIVFHVEILSERNNYDDLWARTRFFFFWINLWIFIILAIAIWCPDYLDKPIGNFCDGNGIDKQFSTLFLGLKGKSIISQIKWEKNF